MQRTIVTALELLERTVQSDTRLQQHVASHTVAQRLSALTEEMIRSGEDRDVVRTALEALYGRYRESGQAVPRDAVAEVLDAFDGLCSPDSAL